MIGKLLLMAGALVFLALVAEEEESDTRRTVPLRFLSVERLWSEHCLDLREDDPLWLCPNCDRWLPFSHDTSWVQTYVTAPQATHARNLCPECSAPVVDWSNEAIEQILDLGYGVELDPDPSESLVVLIGSELGARPTTADASILQLEVWQRRVTEEFDRCVAS